MARLKYTFVGTFVFLTAMWLLSLSPGAFADFWSTRSTLIYYTGILAIALCRPGRDVGGAPGAGRGRARRSRQVLPAARWLTSRRPFRRRSLAAGIVPRWMVRQGWLERPERGGGQGQGQGAKGFSVSRSAGHSRRTWRVEPLSAAGSGRTRVMEAVPYRYFFETHRLMAGRLSGVGLSRDHIDEPCLWTAPLGPVMALLLAGGSVAALTSLFPAHRALATCRWPC